MRILTLPVDDSVADDYYNSPPQEKDRINTIVNMLLTRVLKEKENSSLFDLMKEMSGEAKRNGITIEKLGELMEWDDETIKNLFGESHVINAR